MQKALGLSTFTINIKKHTTGDRLAWLFPPLLGSDIHNFIRIKKGTSYIFPSIIHIYRTYAFMKVYQPAGFTSTGALIYVEYILYVSHYH